MAFGEVAIRGLQASDRPSIAHILATSGAFQDQEIAIGLELVDETLNPTPSTDYRWSIAERDGRVVGFACFGPVPLTEGTYDLYWIAVDMEVRGAGIAARLDEAVTSAVRDLGGRWLLAETSSTGPFAPARAFYARRGYRLLERIEDFYRPGDDRITFGKRLDRG